MFCIVWLPVLNLSTHYARYAANKRPQMLMAMTSKIN
jgi:hypothetical protein